MASPSICSMTITSIGEFRMGCPAFGVVLERDGRSFEMLAKTMVTMTGGEQPTIGFHESDDDRYLLLHGIWATYVVDLDEFTMSVYDVQINERQPDDTFIWSKECAIFGSSTRKITAKDNKFFFVQFPFCSPGDDFEGVLRRFTDMRVEQIKAMKRGV